MGRGGGGSIREGLRVVVIVVVHLTKQHRVELETEDLQMST